MSRHLRLVRAEILKLTTTRTFLALVALAVGLSSLFAGITAAIAGSSGTFGLETSQGVKNVLGASSAGANLALILGIVVVAGERRHGLSELTYLACPNPTLTLAAKSVVVVLGGVVFSLAASAASLAVAYVSLLIKGSPGSELIADGVRVATGLTIAAGMFGLIGVSIGAIAKGPVQAIAVASVWLFAVEGPLIGLLPSAGRWLPGGLSAALMGWSTIEGDLLSWRTALLLLSSYCLALLVVGVSVTARRDPI